MDFASPSLPELARWRCIDPNHTLICTDTYLPGDVSTRAKAEKGRSAVPPTDMDSMAPSLAWFRHDRTVRALTRIQPSDCTRLLMTVRFVTLGRGFPTHTY